MILTRLGPDAPFYRALTPRWAHLPESGSGAAAVGGRFNRPGVEARYLAETAEGALSEYQQESELLPPATLAVFLVTAEQIVDFSGWYNPEEWSPLWAEAYCNWKGLAFMEGVEPSSWAIGDLVRDAGHGGILYRSARDPCCAVSSCTQKMRIDSLHLYMIRNTDFRAIPIHGGQIDDGRPRRNRKRRTQRA